MAKRPGLHRAGMAAVLHSGSDVGPERDRQPTSSGFLHRSSCSGALGRSLLAMGHGCQVTGGTARTQCGLSDLPVQPP